MTTEQPKMNSVTPYLMFAGDCEEALNFYKTAVDADVKDILYFKDSPDPVPAECMKDGLENKVMHSWFIVHGTPVFATDGGAMGGETQDFKGFALTLTVGSEAEVDRLMGNLSAGGQTVMPAGKTFFSPRYGMVKDKYGITWMVMMPAEQYRKDYRGIEAA